MWDEAGVERYEAWFETREGAFAFSQERRLLERLMSPWPRRGQKLLEVGCGPGIFLKVFWEAGFDVTGLDSAPFMLKRARERLGPHAAFHLGQAEHLPFDDNEFDFVALLTVLEFCSESARALLEAARVARKGIIVSFLNRHSFYYLEEVKSKGKSGSLSKAHWFTCREMRRLLFSCVGSKPLQGRSVLPGPKWSWRPSAPWRWINGIAYPLGMGSYCAMRVDLVGEKAMTPLYSFKTEPRLSG